MSISWMKAIENLLLENVDDKLSCQEGTAGRNIHLEFLSLRSVPWFRSFSNNVWSSALAEYGIPDKPLLPVKMSLRLRSGLTEGKESTISPGNIKAGWRSMM